MNVLFIHSDKLNYKAGEKTKFAEPLAPKEKSAKLKECLVCFMSFAEEDDANPEGTAENLAKEIAGVAQSLKEKNIVLYPYVHLLFGKKPSRPETAVKIMALAEQALAKEKYKVVKSPFGYYKAFEIACKGHPLSELSRQITAETKKEAESTAVKAEKTLKSGWFVLEPNGKLNEIRNENGKVAGFNFGNYKGLEKLASYEMAKVRVAKEEPPHVKMMKQLEIADYESGSDPGNMRYPPNGKLVKKLLEEFVSDEMHKYGAVEIESPIMYDYAHPSLKKYLERFPARQYTIKTPNKDVFLRFSACFGQFLMLHDANFSYKQLPLKIFEMTKYSFRVEQSGELTGLRRLRAFTMPDCHALCADMQQAKDEMSRRFEVSRNMQERIGFEIPNDLEFAIRVVKEFWEQNKEFVVGLVKKWGKPALIEMWDRQFFYFAMKYEWNFVDALEKASALNTDQIDIENGKNFDLKFTDANNQQKNPLILHFSPCGAIERVIYALLEKAYMEQQKGARAVLPLWLSPTQVRIATVSDSHLEFANKLADEIEKQNIRVDIDDRVESIGRKIRDAEKDWAQHIIVIGDKEINGAPLNVRIRKTNEQKQMSKGQLIEEIKKRTEGMPFRPIALPRLLSKRPIFVSSN
ncbi:MAG: threonine--tRNA ligase [Candidatus Diapherotrites archaeon]|nr:threonine--tRNA ligase [Candidatus Diapherotrites archaeon]